MPKVLVIEDDPELVSLLCTLLTMEEYSVVTPRNHQIKEVLRLFLDELPEVALVDVNLSLGSGLDLVRQIRAQPELKDTRILMTSGLDMERECMKSGADAFIQKPFMADELLSQIDEINQQTRNFQN